MNQLQREVDAALETIRNAPTPDYLRVPEKQHQYPDETWPGCDKVKRLAAKVGRAKDAETQQAAETKLTAALRELDGDALRRWADVVMIDARFCGATGQGGFWAKASDAVNRLAKELLNERQRRLTFSAPEDIDGLAAEMGRSLREGVKPLLVYADGIELQSAIDGLRKRGFVVEVQGREIDGSGVVRVTGRRKPENEVVLMDGSGSVRTVDRSELTPEAVKAERERFWKNVDEQSKNRPEPKARTRDADSNKAAEGMALAIGEMLRGGTAGEALARREHRNRKTDAVFKRLGESIVEPAIERAKREPETDQPDLFARQKPPPVQFLATRTTGTLPDDIQQADLDELYRIFPTGRRT